MTENSSSAMEIGTSDQVLVAKKSRKKLYYILGAVFMVVQVIVITLVVLWWQGRGGDAEDLINTTTEPGSPTTIVTPSTLPTTASPDIPDIITTTPEPTLPTEPPITEPEEEIDLDDIINGVFSSPSFTGTWLTGSEVLYRNDNGDLVILDVDDQTNTPLITNSSEILQQSSRVSLLSPDRNYVVLAYNVAPVYRHSFLARYGSVNIATGEVTDILPPNINATDAYLQNFVWGPNGTTSAFVYLNNIYYKDSLTSEPQQLTTTGSLNVVHHGIPDWVYEEEVFASNNAMWFSADGSKLAYATFDDTFVRVMRVPHYGVPGSLDYQYTQHHQIPYPKPGTNNPTVTVTIRDLENGTNTVYTGPASLTQPILRTAKFVTNDVIALLWTNRIQNSLSVVLCTSGVSDCTEIYSYSETNGWIDNVPLLFNEEGNSFVTILPQSVNGELYKQVVQVSETTGSALWQAQDRTNTSHNVLDILAWSTDDVVWYKATRVNDSAEQHIYSSNADGVVSCFTCNIVRADGEQCLYNEATFNAAVTRIALNCAGPSVPQIYVYTINGALLRIWDANAETAALVASKKVPDTIRLSVPVAAGLPEADVMIQVPDDYQSRTNVPLLVYVYGGPDSALVTKQWSIDWGTSLVNRWNIAVAHIDGRGSGLRGVANTFALHRRLGSVEVEDQINVTRYLHENLSWLDSNRTCIWGWSYGGYASSLALARGGDVFRCAIAVAPVVDWRFYDTIYTERYMDLPANNVDAYTSSSLLTQEVVEAFRNKRYFLIHGTADDNVHYQHAMLISRLLQRSDVYFTQMSYTDQDHGLVGVRPHLYHALEKYLQDNML